MWEKINDRTFTLTDSELELAIYVFKTKSSWRVQCSTVGLSAVTLKNVKTEEGAKKAAIRRVRAHLERKTRALHRIDGEVSGA